MKPWRWRLVRHPAPAPSPALQTEFALSDLKRSVRRAVVADRARLVTASLRRFVDQGGACPLRPRDEVVAAYEGMVALAGQEAMQGRAPLDGPLRLELVATFPIAASWSKAKRRQAETGLLWHTARPDGDNILKAIGDGLNGVCWTDDSVIASSEIVKRYGVQPGVAVTVAAL